MEQEKSGLLPTEIMRSELEKRRANDVENKVNADLARYTDLFTRWKAAEELSKDEITEMTDLSAKLESVKNQLENNN